MKHGDILKIIGTTSILFLLFISKVSSQCADGKYSFQPGEIISYSAVYNWGFIWVNAGTVDFIVEENKNEDDSTFLFKGIAKSLKSYDWFFKVRDYFYSEVDCQTFYPIWFERNTSEGGYEVLNKYSFDYTTNRIYSDTQNSDKPRTLDTLAIEKTTHDVLSGVYQVRNIDFSKYNINDTIPVRMIIDNEIFNLYVRYLGKEILKTRDNRKFRTLKFSALLVEGTIFKGGEDLFVWVTDDKNKIPVLVEAKILVGSIKALLVNTANLKYPMEAEIIVNENY